MIVSAAGRVAGSFAESTHEKDVQAGKEAQATVCDLKPEDQHQSCKIREGVRHKAWYQGSAAQLPGARQLESRPLQLGRVTIHLPEN